jgi:putative ABC transport system permease protein
MRTFLQDLRYGVRVVARQPGYALLIVLTLALAIGANAVTFSFTNILLVRPLPVHDQATLVWIFGLDPQRGDNRGLMSVPDLLDYRASLRSVGNLAGTTSGAYTLTGRGDALPVVASRVTANLFDTWGLNMVIGRSFSKGEDAPGAARVVALSHTFWQRKFQGDPSIVGQSLTLNGEPYAVIGVLTPSIEIGNLSEVDVWTTVTLDPSLARDARTLRVTGRLAQGSTFEHADAEVRTVSQRLQQDHPKTNAGLGARLASSREAMTGNDTWVILALLSLVVTFVLLIACANIANLVLARATGRRRELAVRAALGASRGRMVRQLLTEKLLGLLGGVLALGVAHGGLTAIKAAAYEPFFQLVVIDRNVLLFTALLALLTPPIFSLLPALQSSRTDVHDTLKESSLRAGGGVRGRRSRAVLVVSQLALAMMLLIVSGLFVRSMIALNKAPLGFDPVGVLTLRLTAPEWRYSTDAAVMNYYDRLIARLQSLPGVKSVAAADHLPVLGSAPAVQLTVDGHVPAKPEDRPWAVPVVATEHYFSAAGIPVTGGRTFTREDSTASRRVALVNEEMARRYLNGPARAVGARFALDRENREWIEIVGVAADVKRPDLLGSNPQVYLPAAHQPARTMSIMIRAANADALMAAVRGEVRSIDPEVAVHRLRTIEQALNEELASSRILNGMFISFALLALVLAASGLYGVLSYAVSQRAQEIGIRMALGAMTRDIRRLIVRQTIVLVLIGSVLGLAGGAAIARATSSVLYDVTATDPPTYVAVFVLLVTVAALATLAPLRRATSIDPITALRTE